MNPLKVLENQVETNSIEALEKTNELIEKTPTINDKVYEKLPKVLQDICNINVENKRRRDVSLLSCLTTLSGMFPNVYGYYFGEKVYPNLFLYISGKAATGKSVMKIGLDILSKRKEDLERHNETMLKNYEYELCEWEAATSKERRDNKMTKPQPPMYKYISMSPNISHSKFLENVNCGIPIMFSTEADSMANAQGQDWGNYSADLRSIFHHESISKDRLGSGRLEIDTPKMSLVLSGTLDQTFKVLGKSQDGLFSRFLIYNFSSEDKFVNPFNMKIVENELDYSIRTSIYDTIISYRDIYDMQIRLSDKQYKSFDTYMNDIYEMSKLSDDTGDIGQVVKRHALMAFRMMMIFTCLRNKPNLFECPSYLTCIDDDFENSLNIMKCVLSHSKLIYYSQIEKKVTLTENKNDRVKKIIDKLPVEFSRKMVIDALPDVSESVIDRTIKKLKSNGKVESNGRDYKKIIK